MNRWFIFCVFSFVVVAACATVPCLAQHGDAATNPEPLLRYSIVGSSSCAETPCYGEVMKSVAVQEFLLELARGPREVHVADAALEGAAVNVEDLRTLRLIRREGDRYFLNFALFTGADLKRVRDASEHYAGSLAQAVLARREEIENVLEAYDAPGVDPGAVAYFLLGCASLDWDGLGVTDEKGYRKTTEERPDGNYVPAAEEIADVSLEKVYWGSHNWAYDGVSLTSFGDHHSLPRIMLPDLLWRPPEVPSSYPDTVKAALQELLVESFERSGHQLGRMMLALRDAEKSSADLAQEVGARENEIEALLHTLVALDYVGESNGLYRAKIPVLTRGDEVMAKGILAIGKQVMEQWLADNYESIHADLEGLSCSRAGVPFSEAFTMIWHYLFGIANRKLVEAGLFADPYATTRAYKGAIPVVHELALP